MGLGCCPSKAVCSLFVVAPIMYGRESQLLYLVFLLSCVCSLSLPYGLVNDCSSSCSNSFF